LGADEAQEETMEQAAVGALVLGAVVLAAAVGGFLWARRVVRRRVRSLRQRVAASGVDQVRGWAQRLDAGALLHLEPFDATWREGYRSRWRMQRAVRGAKDAVRRAEAVGAPIGDLAAVLRRTEDAAGQVDVLMGVVGRYGAHVDAPAQAGSVTRAAEAIRRAAIRAVADCSGPAVARAAAEADDEAKAVLAGLQRARGV